MTQVTLDSLVYAQDPTQASLAVVLKETARIRIWDEGISGDEDKRTRALSAFIL